MPAGGDTYTIRARFVVDDQSGRGIGAASRGVTQLENRVTAAGSRMSSAFGSAIGLLAGGLAFGAATRGIIRMNDQIDISNAGLATLFSAVTGAPIEQAMGAARESIVGLREDAAAGVGELQDYVQTFQGILAPVLNAGGTTDVARELTKNALGAGFALGGEQGLKTVGMDIKQSITQSAGTETPIVTAALGGSAAVAEFNKLDVAGKVTMLNEAFGKFAPGIELMGKTWAAQMGTMKDNINNILITVTRPVFDRWKDALMKANEWIKSNKDLIEEMATVGGEKLLAMWDNLIANARTYASIVGGASLAKGVGSVAGAAGVGVTGVGAAGLAVVSVAIVGAALAVSGALEQWPSLMVGIAESGDRLWESLLPLGESFGRLSAEGSLLNIVGAAIVVVFVALIENMITAAAVINVAIDAFGTFIRIIGNEMLTLVNVARAWALGDAMGGFLAGQAGQKKTANLIQGFRDRRAEQASARKGEAPGGEDGLGGLPTTGVGDTIINGPINVKMKVEQNADPARVLTSWKEVLERAVRFKDGAAPERR